MVGGGGLVKLAFHEVDDPQGVESFDLVRILLECCVKGGDGDGSISGEVLRPAQNNMAIRIIGIEGSSNFEGGHGSLQIAAGSVVQSPLTVALGSARIHQKGGIGQGDKGVLSPG